MRSGTRSQLVALLLPLLFAPEMGCHDMCKADNLSPAERCKCRPRDDELHARLWPTPLSYPARQSVKRCSREIASTTASIVSKQSLRACTQNDSTLDGPTREALAMVIEASNLPEQVEVDNFHSCQAIGTPVTPYVPPTVPPPGAAPSSVSPGPTSAPPSFAPASPTPPPAATPPARPATPPGSRDTPGDLLL